LGISARISVRLIRTSFHSIESFRLRHVIRSAFAVRLRRDR
jgi:hypothetical protein